MDAYDVVVIGGGAAGLSGALALSRAQRSVLVIDGGQPRNAPAGHVHNYLGREGTPPADLLAIGRDEVTGYGGRIRSGQVAAVERVPGDDPRFRVSLHDGSSVEARRVLVATGLVDRLPDLPGLAERWGIDVLHCPYCHGYEVRDRAVAVLGAGPFAVHQALLFRQWCPDVTLLVHRAADPTPEEAERLAARDVRVVDGEVVAVTTDPDGITGVRLVDGQEVACQALVVGPRFDARADFLAPLGLVPVEQQINGYVYGSAIPAEPTGATAVPGVYVAGNVSDLRAQVVTAASAGLSVAAMLNNDLVEEDVRLAVARRAGERSLTGRRAG